MFVFWYKFTYIGSVNDKSALVQVMAWQQTNTWTNDDLISTLPYQGWF